MSPKQNVNIIIANYLRRIFFFILFFTALPFTGYAQAGTNMDNAIPMGSFSACAREPFKEAGDNGMGYSDNFNPNVNPKYYSGQPSPDVWYSFTIEEYTDDITFSLCGSEYDTYMHVLDESGNIVYSNDDAYPCGTSSEMILTFGLGKYYLVVEGSGNNTGIYFLNVFQYTQFPSGAKRNNAINAGTFNSSGTYSHTLSNVNPCLGNDFGQPSIDIYYKFTLNEGANVKLSHCGSGFDTYMSLLNEQGSLIKDNDDGGPNSPCPGEQAFIETTLPAGTYYLVSEGSGSNSGVITTNIQVVGITPPVIDYRQNNSHTFTSIINTEQKIIPTNTGGEVSLEGQFTTTLLSTDLGYGGGLALDASGNLYMIVDSKIMKVSKTGEVTVLVDNGILYGPSGISVDHLGNVFVSEEYNHRICKITPNGVISIFAGSGVPGSADGTGTSASFNYPQGLIVDTQGNLFVADYQNNKIRKITPSGIVTTFAGTGSTGSLNGPVLSATFNRPISLAFDNSGNLYVGDELNFMVRKITKSGIVSTLAGSGTFGYAEGMGESAKFGFINSIIVDRLGNVYVADGSNCRIRQISASGIVSTFAGTGISSSEDGIGSMVSFDIPNGLCINPFGNVFYVLDWNKLRKITLLNGYAISPQLPTGLSLNSATGEISGIPIETSPLTAYNITASNVGGSSNAYMELQVVAEPCLIKLNANPNIDQNFVLTYTAKKPSSYADLLAEGSICEVSATVEYLDGLGRPLQSVQVKGSVDGTKDVIQLVEYDQVGRNANIYLPYVGPTSNGSYRTNALTEQQSFFNSLPIGMGQNLFPFSRTIFEPSSLNRVKEQGATGEDWQPVVGSSTGHTQKIVYGVNAANEVRLFIAESVIISGETYKRNLIEAGYYTAGQLSLTVSKDENWQAGDGKVGTVEEYKDKEGRVVLKRMFNEKSGIEILSTYYVYDDLGNLSFVLPPGADPDAGVPGTTALKNYCYQYRYDGRKRLIEKHIPGKDGWEEMIYNKLDQLVLSRDPNLAVEGKWLFNKYDVLGRTILTGMLTRSGSRTTLQGELDAEADGTALDHPLWETRTEGNDYTNLAYPRSYDYLLTVNYFDNYDFPGKIAAFDFVAFAEYADRSNMIRGLSTGNKVRHLGTGAMQLSVLYYDDKGQAIQVHSEHHLGGTDRTDTRYHFDGSVEYRNRTHKKGTVITTIATAYSYDHRGRPIQTIKSINGATPIILSQQSYNEIGQLKQKSLHNVMQTTNYTYNERGWLKGSNAKINETNSVIFGMELGYNSGSYPQYNGNISVQDFVNNDLGTPNSFVYQYDKLSRLLDGTANGMSEVWSYDRMGNIATLNRDNTGQMTYSYQDGGFSSRLEAVSGLTGGYGYDANGNATLDGRNGVSLGYNHLNLPVTATKVVSGVTTVGLTYTYDATGAKLRKHNSIGVPHITDYVNGIQYTNGSIDFIQTEEGIAKRNGTTGAYSYEYNLVDHLGNIRATFYQNPASTELEVLQRDNYYAFGLRKDPVVKPGTNNYLYNGKELQNELGGQYDYAARFYDPVIGRWNVIDPKAEQMRMHSSYNYALNNPIRFIDPDGKRPFDQILLNSHGKEIGRIKDKGPNQYYMAMNTGDHKWESKSRNTNAIRVLSPESITGDPREKQPFKSLNESFTAEKQSEMITKGTLGIGDKGRGRYLDIMLESKTTGSLDYKNEFNAGELINLNGIYMNNHEALNYMWGASMSELKVDVTDALIGAQAFHVYDSFFGRSKGLNNQDNHDEAIIRGHYNRSGRDNQSNFMEILQTLLKLF